MGEGGSESAEAFHAAAACGGQRAVGPHIAPARPRRRLSTGMRAHESATRPQQAARGGYGIQGETAGGGGSLCARARKRRNRGAASAETLPWHAPRPKSRFHCPQRHETSLSYPPKGAWMARQGAKWPGGKSYLPPARDNRSQPINGSEAFARAPRPRKVRKPPSAPPVAVTMHQTWSLMALRAGPGAGPRPGRALHKSKHLSRSVSPTKTPTQENSFPPRTHCCSPPSTRASCGWSPWSGGR